MFFFLHQRFPHQDFEETKGKCMCNKDSLLGFVAGVGCGVGISLLLAPKSGDETRLMIANGARDGKDQIQRHATDLLHKGQEKLQRQKDSLKHAVEAGVQAFQSHVE